MGLKHISRRDIDSNPLYYRGTSGRHVYDFSSLPLFLCSYYGRRSGGIRMCEQHPKGPAAKWAQQERWGERPNRAFCPSTYLYKEGVLPHILLSSSRDLLSPQGPLHKLLRPAAIMKKKDE